MRMLGWMTKGARALLVACQPTADTTRGPLYRRGAPWRTRLCPVDEPGEPLSITGTLTASADCRPIPNATLDIWQTNARGLYSNLLGLGNPSNPRTFNLRGITKTDHEGRYRFESIVPGRYPLFWRRRWVVRGGSDAAKPRNQCAPKQAINRHAFLQAAQVIDAARD